MIDSRLHLLARNQFGIISRRQLHDLGVSSDWLLHARRSSVLVDVTSRTIRLTSFPDTFVSRATAVSLHIGDRGFLSGPTAARLYGLREMSPSSIHVTLAAGERPMLPSWTKVRSTNSFDPECDRHDMPGGAIVAEPHRLLCELATTLDDRRFRSAADDCWHLGLLTPTSVQAHLRTHRCCDRDETGPIERWLSSSSGHDSPGDSGLALDLVDTIERMGLPEPVRHHPVRLSTGEQIHLDVAWPDIGLAVEPGRSWWRRDVDGHDESRLLAVQALGWEVIHFDESLRTDPARAARIVRSAFRRRRAVRIAS